MLTLAYPGASTLVNARGETVIECATPEIATYLERQLNAVGGLDTSLESANQHCVVRSEIEVAQVWRGRPEELKP